MRPVKLVHRLLIRASTPAQIEQRLLSEYRLEAEKARLLVEIASANRPYLHSADEAGQWVSVYLGIPYCPSRCYYCSFPGAVVKDYEADIVPFLKPYSRRSGHISLSSGTGLKSADCIPGRGHPYSALHLSSGAAFCRAQSRRLY